MLILEIAAGILLAYFVLWLIALVIAGMDHSYSGPVGQSSNKQKRTALFICCWGVCLLTIVMLSPSTPPLANRVASLLAIVSGVCSAALSAWIYGWNPKD
jgi:hypothetical protein